MYAKFGKTLALAAVLCVTTSYAAESNKPADKTWTQTITSGLTSAKNNVVLYGWNLSFDEKAQQAWVDAKSWKPWFLKTYKAGVVLGGVAALYYAYAKYTEPVKARTITYKTTGYTA